MFREMRRKENQLSMRENEEILMKGEYGVLATIGLCGYPYAVPLNYVYYNGGIYFHCAAEGEKLDNIKKCPNVSLCVSCDIELLPEKFTTNYRSVVLFGQAKEVTDNEKKETLLALIEKYSGDFIEEGKKCIENINDRMKVLKINIEHITGKQNSRDLNK